VKGPILCFVDLQASARLAAKSIATSSAASSSALGGMRDEAEIRGHRRRIGASG
jgi:ATP-dependent Lon protease